MKSSAALTALWSATVSALMFLVMYYFVAPRLPVNAAEVPPLIGLSPEQARGLLDARGLLLVIDGETASGEVPAGSLAEQRPLGGSHLRRGDEVHASLARPAAPLQVPTVAGMTLDAAKEAIGKAKLKVGRVTEAPSDATARGLVVSTTPAAGSEARAETYIDLTVSTGPATAAVPPVVGKSLSKAKTLIETAGFAVGATKYGSHDDYETGIVIKQNPAAGALATPGVKIDLVIND